MLREGSRCTPSQSTAQRAAVNSHVTLTRGRNTAWRCPISEIVRSTHDDIVFHECAGFFTGGNVAAFHDTAYFNEPSRHPDPFGAAQGMLREGSRCMAVRFMAQRAAVNSHVTLTRGRNTAWRCPISEMVHSVHHDDALHWFLQ
jgi:hypothetical protein